MEEKDYKKLYEDVVALAKDGLKDGLYLSRSAKDVTEFLFPQLKETEEEKARKGLVRFLINFNNGCYSKPSETEIDAWIKWINKKCEQKPVECIKFDNEFENQISHLIASVLNGEHEYNEGFVKYASQSLLGFANKDQNHTDKVEPKFKAGDWVVYNRDDSSREIIQVSDIRDGRYYFTDNIHFSWSIKECNEKSHLWTIQDAKDGDVLYFSDETIAIFKDLYNATTFHSYCHIEDGLFAISKDDMPDWWDGKGFQPANKEQSDLLFSKMKEAGYEWDAEKKELNKIEKQGEQKSVEWSEEDEHCIELLLPIIDSSSLIPKNRKRCKEFLKSIKDRVQPQSKQEWSEEDKSMYIRTLGILGKCYMGELPTKVEEELKWFKSIESQSHWKPSKEQMNALDKAKNNPSNYYDIRLGLQSLYNDLLKL